MTESIDITKRTAQYVALRDKIRVLNAEHDEKMKPFNEALEQLGNMLLSYLNDQGVQNVKTEAGTPHKTSDVSCTTGDKEAFFNWVLTGQRWQFLDVKPNKTAVRDYVNNLLEQAKKDPNIVPMAPPGVNYSSRWKIGVTRGK